MPPCTDPMNSIPPIPTTADASITAPLPFEFPSFVPRAPWWGADLQTVRSVLLRQSYGLEDFPEKSLRFRMPDGTGDVLHGILNRPAEPGDLPLVVLVHGLTGCAESHYMRASAAILLRRGLYRDAPQPARCRAVASLLRRAVPCRPDRGSPGRAGATAAGADPVGNRAGRLLAGRQSGPEAAGGGSARRRDRGSGHIGAHRSGGNQPADDEPPQLPVSPPRRRPDEGGSPGDADPRPLPADRAECAKLLRVR